MIPTKLSFLVTVIAGLSTASGCIEYDDGPHRQYVDTPSSPTPPSPTAATVLVDTDKTMTAIGGQGVGVFVEYRSGGDWHVWWTCDTQKSSRSCNFAVTIGATGDGFVTTTDGAPSHDIGVTGGTDSTVFRTATTTQVHDVTFSTTPGASVLMGATIDGTASPEYFFFVQDGKVNGGFRGTLTNPVYFQPKSP